MSYARVTLLVGVALVVIGMAQFVRPFGPPMLRNSPILVIIVGALFMARYAARAVALKRRQMIDEVPKHPLGLSDDN